MLAHSPLALWRRAAAHCCKSRNSKIETQTSAQLREKIVALNRQMMETFKRGPFLRLFRPFCFSFIGFYARRLALLRRDATSSRIADKRHRGAKPLTNTGSASRRERLEARSDRGRRRGDAIYQIGTSSLTTERDGKRATTV